MKYDFSGYATRNDLQCSDGRVIRRDAFKDNDGKTVPLVWQHMHDSPDNILGHAQLENRNDGVYAYCTFNSTPYGQQAKELVKHGDITSLSIYANQLRQHGNDVLHGAIREVSLVLAGANPGAMIDNIGFAHSDGSIDDLEDEAIVYTGLNFELYHADDAKEENKPDAKSDDEGADDDGETVEDVFNTLSEKQKNVVYAIIGSALEGKGGESSKTASTADDEEMAQSAMEGTDMKHNVFDNSADDTAQVLSHSEMAAIISDAKQIGSLKTAALQHGITDIDILFPEAKAVNQTPYLISREMAWVDSVLSAVHKSPFSRIKSTAANITADEARAKGYIKGNKKVEEVITALKRTTTPQTVYKLQKLDRDDIIDITDFDVVAFLKAEMRTMLNEELARAILIGDGRLASSNDKIKEDNIRPIWSDDETYAVHTLIDDSDMERNERASAFIDACIRARKNYKGSGSPVMYIGSDLLTDMRLLRNSIGERLFKTDQELADELRVSRIQEIELLDEQTRNVDGNTREYGAIIVNLTDYTMGADKGGEVSLFDDFDLDYNKYEYLIETRCSGALTRPMSALVIEFGAEA